MTKRNIVINRTINKCYAKLALAHFKEAEKAVALSSDTAVQATDRRLAVIERYVERAGGQATLDVFSRYF